MVTDQPTDLLTNQKTKQLRKVVQTRIGQLHLYVKFDSRYHLNEKITKKQRKWFKRIFWTKLCKFWGLQNLFVSIKIHLLLFHCFQLAYLLVKFYKNTSLKNLCQSKRQNIKNCKKSQKTVIRGQLCSFRAACAPGSAQK